MENEIIKRLDEKLDEHFSVNSKFGSYKYHLTRDKEAFEIGTMTFHDFVEIDFEEDTAESILKAIKHNLIK